MSNIIISEAAQWTEAEAQRNFKTLQDMGLDEWLQAAKKVRGRGGAEDSPEPHLAGETDLQDTKGKGKK